MKHLVLEVTSPKSDKRLTITLCEAYTPDQENRLRQILREGGGITELRSEIAEKVKWRVVWKA